MSVQLIAELLRLFGPPAVQLIDTLIKKWETNGVVTAEEWSALSVSLKLTSKDHMTAQLTKAGIDLNSPEAIALLNLTK